MSRFVKSLGQWYVWCRFSNNRLNNIEGGGFLKRFSFPKKKRLVNNRQFKAVLAQGRRISNELLTLYMSKNDCGFPRLGVSVKKSCGNAVVRNRLKRLAREAFRQSQGQIPAGFDYLLVVSPQWLKSVCRLLAGLAEPKEAVRRLTFERVKASFLALVAGAVAKIG